MKIKPQPVANVLLDRQFQDEVGAAAFAVMDSVARAKKVNQSKKKSFFCRATKVIVLLVVGAVVVDLASKR